MKIYESYKYERFLFIFCGVTLGGRASYLAVMAGEFGAAIGLFLLMAYAFFSFEPRVK